MNKLTLKEKKLLNEYVTGETKRCLSLVKEAISMIGSTEPEDIMIDVHNNIITGSPFLEFNQELKKRLIRK